MTVGMTFRLILADRTIVTFQAIAGTLKIAEKSAIANMRARESSLAVFMKKELSIKKDRKANCWIAAIAMDSAISNYMHRAKNERDILAD